MTGPALVDRAKRTINEWLATHRPTRASLGVSEGDVLDLEAIATTIQNAKTAGDPDVVDAWVRVVGRLVAWERTCQALVKLGHVIRRWSARTETDEELLRELESELGRIAQAQGTGA